MLKAGTPVQPKVYASATVLFTDIYGWATLSAQCTPVQIINLLNHLFSQYDNIPLMAFVTGSVDALECVVGRAVLSPQALLFRDRVDALDRPVLLQLRDRGHLL